MVFVPHWCLVLIMFSLGKANSQSHDQDCYPDYPIRDGLLCYPKCKAGYANYGQGPVCWAKCPKQTTNIGVSCSKNTYGRGVGVPLSSCPSGTEKNALLCYPLCHSRYNGVGPICWQHCKKGENDDGALCRQALHVSVRDTGSCPWYDKCGLCGGPWYNVCGKRRNCGGSCKPGYVNDGCTCRRPLKVYAKHSYGRGVGKPLICASHLELSGLLCYPKCKSGYYGVGPACWARCSRETSDTGAFCQKNSYGRGFGKPLSCIGAITKAYAKKTDIGKITDYLTNTNEISLTKAVCFELWAIAKPLMLALSKFMTCNKKDSWNTIVFSFSGSASVLLSKDIEIGLAADLKKNEAACYVGHCTGLNLDASVGVAVNFGWFKSLDDIPGESIVVSGALEIPFTEIGIPFAGVTNTEGIFIGAYSFVGLGVGLSPLPFDIGVSKCNTPKDLMIYFTP